MPAVPFDAIASNLIAAGVLAVAAVACGRWLNRPAVAHVLWLLVLVKLVTPPLFTVPIRVLPPEELHPVVADSGPEVIVPRTAVDLPEIVIRSQAEPPSATSETPTPAAVTPTVPAAPPFPWRSVVAVVWLAGIAAWAAFTVVHVRRFAKYLRFGTAAPDSFAREVADVAARLGLRAPRVRLLPGEVAPFVWSVGKTTLYFPHNLLDRLTAEQRATVVAHELAHVWRRDHLVRWLETVTVAVYWWCPLAWLARRELRRLEEDCCDAVVMTIYPGAGPTYASAILDTIDFLATARATPRFASAMGDVRSLRTRLTRILDGSKPRHLSRTVRVALLAFAVVLLAAGPRLARLTAMVLPISEGRPTGLGERPAVLEQPSREAVQFLPTPIRLKLADELETITAAAMSPDGRFLALAVGSQVMVWDLDAKRVAFTLTGHAETVNAVAYSPDGRSLATAGNDAAVKVWNLQTGTHRTLSGHANWVLAIAFSPDGRRLASAGYGKQVLLHDLKAGDIAVSLPGHTATVRAVAFSPDGRRLASVGADSLVKVWDAEQGREERTLTGHIGTVRTARFSPDSLRLATGGEDRTIRVWNPTDGTAVVIPSPEAVTALTFSAGGSTLFAGTFAGHVLNINPAAGKLRGHVGPPQPTHAEAIAAVLLSPTGHLLFTLSHDGTVLVWPSAGLPETARQSFRHPRDVTAVALSADGRIVATGGQDGGIRVWNAATAQEAGRFDGHAGGVTAMVFLDETRLLSVGRDERVRVWDLKRGQPIRAMVVPTADPKIAVSPNGKTLAVTGPRMAGVMLWDIESGSLFRRIATRLDGLTAVAFLPNGQKIALGNNSGDVIICQLPTGKEESRLPVAESGTIDQILFSRDGGRAAVVINRDADGESPARHEVAFWDVWTRTRHESFRPITAGGRIHAVAFDPTETRVFTAGHDGHVYEWDVATGQRTRMLHAHREAVVSLVVPRDGRAILSAGDEAAKFWDWPQEKLP
ncbi:M56 family metallopeptidase [Limnoglobus roseus]|uniref:WD40 repeat domain-containing protein n=1 Tax=Limnoglobus roseus TaxID=2598579 RepID=A0A5C1AS49_9BACT|nr:M56 family metallopeptidase [Limnoglobus roseus]QEL19718.1 WD40 repeat domain-containing protein [Limnoglobus roseus]